MELAKKIRVEFSRSCLTYLDNGTASDLVHYSFPLPRLKTSLKLEINYIYGILNYEASFSVSDRCAHIDRPVRWQ